jgi:hypothetical protein
VTFIVAWLSLKMERIFNALQSSVKLCTRTKGRSHTIQTAVEERNIAMEYIMPKSNYIRNLKVMGALLCAGAAMNLNLYGQTAGSTSKPESDVSSSPMGKN